MPLRWRRIYQKYDLLVIHCELFPFLPPFFEFALSLLKVPFVYDYDDAIFHQYDQHPNPLVRKLFANKISFIIGKAKMIFAGSPYLAEYAKRFNPSVENMPTSVSIKSYQARLWPASPPAASHQAIHPIIPSTIPLAIPPTNLPPVHARIGRPFVIGWIGTPSTTPYLSEVADAFKLFCEKHPTPGQIQIKLVGAAAAPADLSYEGFLSKLFRGPRPVRPRLFKLSTWALCLCLTNPGPEGNVPLSYSNTWPVASQSSPRRWG
jgi:hypothetical protein